MGPRAYVETEVCPGCGRPLDKAEQAEIERATCDALYEAARLSGRPILP